MKRLEREPGAPHLTFRVLALAQKQVAPGSGIPEVAASGIFTSGHLALRELTLPTYKLKKVVSHPTKGLHIVKTWIEQAVSIIAVLLVLQGCKTPEPQDAQLLISPLKGTTVSAKEDTKPAPANPQRRKYLQITCPAEWMAEEGMPLYTLDDHDRFLNDLSGLDGKTVLLEFYGEIQTRKFANNRTPINFDCHWGGCKPRDQQAPILKPPGNQSTNISIEFTSLHRYVSNDLRRCERAVYGTGEQYWCMAVRIELAKEDDKLTVILHPQ